MMSRDGGDMPPSVKARSEWGGDMMFTVVEPTMITVQPTHANLPTTEESSRRRRWSNSNSHLLLILSLILLIITPVTTTAISLTRATIQTQIIAVDPAASIHASSTHNNNQTQSAAATELTRAKIGIITLTFDETIWVRREGVNSTSSPLIQSITDVTTKQLYGLTRMICGRSLFESHPVRPDGSFTPKLDKNDLIPHILPGFMLFTPTTVSGPWTEQWPLLSLLDDQLLEEEINENEEPDSNPQTHKLRGFLVLGSSRNGVWTNRVDSSLDQCEIRVLDRLSQSWLPTGSLQSANSGAPLVTRKLIEWIRTDPIDTTSKLLKPTPLSSKTVENLLRSVQAARPRIPRARTTTFLETSGASGADVQSGMAVTAQSGVKFAGILKPIITALLKGGGLGDPMGNMVGDFTADGILDPISEKVLDGIVEAVQAGLTQYVTNDIVVQVIPGVCETVTMALTESTARAIAEAVVRGTTETITSDVTTRVTHTIVDPATLRSSQMISVKLARILHNSLTHMLSRSIPHIVVPALLNTVSVGLKEDYYCYFCKANGMYCQYCQKNRGDTATRLYYALYYTGYHTTYYSNWYANQRKFGVLMLQKRQLNALDDVDDSDEKAWDIEGREAEEGSQPSPPVPTPEEGDGDAGGDGGGDGGDGGDGGGDE